MPSATRHPQVNLPRWTHLWLALGATGDAASPYNRLIARHSEPHRHYHDLRHISECLAEFDAARNLAKQPPLLEAALWFHDAIYDIAASDNEAQSAQLAQQIFAEASVPRADVRHIQALILATKTHTPGLTPDADLICDIDLSILGQSPARYAEYETAIRQEYAAVPADLFAAKRTEILQRFLSRPHIYHTDLFRTRYETTARHNLESAITALT